MPFDKPTRNLLAKMVAAARERLAEDIANQIQSAYGLYPDGARLAVAQTVDEQHGAEQLCALLDHFESLEPAGVDKKRKASAYQRLVREIGFTLLNRLAALRLCEERGLVIECVRGGMNSAGFQLYDRLAGGGLGNRYQTYRAFLEGMFDELALDLGALFDRATPQSVIFPGEPALNDVLALLNTPELTARNIWQQDETIGWIYQYYNDPAERKQMRDASQAPRTSRELAVRNQFFTPRYVVEFLTDNTLGRTWYEMCQGETRLTEQCQYLVRRRHPIFLPEGQEAPQLYRPTPENWGDPDLPGEMWLCPNPEIKEVGAVLDYALTVNGYEYSPKHLGKDCAAIDNEHSGHYRETGQWEGSFEELRCCLFMQQRDTHWSGRPPEGDAAKAVLDLYQAICKQWDLEVDVIPFRAKKDPRRLRVLDPASGSGHFLLYAFDLLETIYAEAYIDPDLGPELCASFPDRSDFVRQVPRLILENNLHGIDIDPRAAQIAALALWLRAQRAWQGLKLDPTQRPAVKKVHIVVAEPMPGDEGLLEEFIADLPKDQHPEVIGPLVRTVFEKMKLAGEAGSLLKIEEELKDAVEQARKDWSKAPQLEQLSLLPQVAKPKQLALDISGVTDESFWQQAETLVLQAMEEYAKQAENGKGVSRRLFVGDAAQGFAFIDLCRKRYDVIVMNPPFGEPGADSINFIRFAYPRASDNLLIAFIERFYLLCTGRLGALTDRSFVNKRFYEDFRIQFIISQKTLETFADLGWNVLDDANVEVCAHVHCGNAKTTIFWNVSLQENKQDMLFENIKSLKNAYLHDIVSFKKFPGSALVYDLDAPLVQSFDNGSIIGDKLFTSYGGLKAGNADHLFRLISEVDPDQIGLEKKWAFFQNGSPFVPYYYGCTSVVRSDAQRWSTVLSYDSSRITNNNLYFLPGIFYGKRTDWIYGYLGRSGQVPSMEGHLVLPSTSFGIWKSLLFINSSPYQEIINHLCGQHKYAGYINPARFPIDIIPDWTDRVKKVVANLESIDSGNETSAIFVCPTSLTKTFNKPEFTLSIKKVISWRKKISDEANSLRHSYNDAIENELNWHPEKSKIAPQNVDYVTILFGSEDCERLEYQNILSYIFGISLGRWDIRVTGYADCTKENFELSVPLPSFSPGMLKISKDFSGDYLNLLDKYPITLPWDGILVDDPGLGEYPEPHERDILLGVERALQFLWPETYETIAVEASQILGVKDLREYFRRPSGFFADHLRRYSKSRRQAPIYWPLSTPSGSYTLWIYYQRLTSETLYTANLRYLTPKIEKVEAYLHKMETDLGESFGRSTGSLRDQVDSARAFLAELNDLRAELLRVANLPYQPDLNDGVIINAAPLYKLFRLGKWSKDCQAVWEKLEAEEYDWAHMTYVLWPGRVREKCKSDKSLAIAHGLEELYQGLEKAKKVKRKKKVEEEQDELGF